MATRTAMRAGVIVALASCALGGCSTVTSNTATMGSEGPGGALWYVRDGSKVFYCPPQVQDGSHQCTRARIVDEYKDVGIVPPGARLAPAAPAWQPQPQAPVLMPQPAAGGCRADTDCKSGRVCRGGACTQP